MKRSEMLMIITKAIADHESNEVRSRFKGKVITWKGMGVARANQYAKTILAEIEEAGMLPPEIYVPRGPFETVECEWEPEDD